MLDSSAVVYRVVLTKCDKPKAAELALITDKVAASLKKHPAALPDLIFTSARKNIGLAELRADLATLANPR